MARNKWLENARTVYRDHKEEVNSQVDEDTQANRPVEVNGPRPARPLRPTEIVQRAFAERQELYLHG